MKPGAMLLAFGGTRTVHRLVCAIEDAGLAIRNAITWHYSSGFPKSLNIGKSLTRLLPASLRCSCVHHSTNTDGDSRSDCPPDHDLYDEQLLSETEVDRDVFPSQADVLACIRDAPCLDVLEKALTHILDRSSNAPLSIEDVDFLVEGLKLDSLSSDNTQYGILESMLHASLMELHKMGHCKSGNSCSASGSAFSLAYSRSFLSRVTSIYHKCSECKKYFGVEGWGTDTKPATEIICCAMKPLDGTYTANALKHGVAGFNVDGARIGNETRVSEQFSYHGPTGTFSSQGEERHSRGFKEVSGRWPANLILDEAAAAELDAQSGVTSSAGGIIQDKKERDKEKGYGMRPGLIRHGKADSGGASRFFKIITDDPLDSGRFRYCAKPSRAERNAGLEGMPKRVRTIGYKRCAVCGKQKVNVPGSECKCAEPEWVNVEDYAPSENHHPTCKPVKLLRYLALLTKTPTGGIVLDPFMGSGSTGVAAVLEGRGFIGIEKEAEYFEIAKRRLAHALAEYSSDMLSILDEVETKTAPTPT